jgi:acyl-CoA reductase-like NAD-dependent aldehyde dehydrogenase
MEKTHIISLNPATLQETGKVPITPPRSVPELVERSRRERKRGGEAFRTRNAAHSSSRPEIICSNISTRSARTITEDNGKPLVESLTAEIYPIADLFFFFAHNTRRILKSSRICTGVWEFDASLVANLLSAAGVVGIVSP